MDECHGKGTTIVSLVRWARKVILNGGEGLFIKKLKLSF